MFTMITSRGDEFVQDRRLHLLASFGVAFAKSGKVFMAGFDVGHKQAPVLGAIVTRKPLFFQ
jgi:hypothetical protein